MCKIICTFSVHRACRVCVRDVNQFAREQFKKHCDALSGENTVLMRKFSEMEKRYSNLLLRDDNQTAYIEELKAKIGDLVRKIIDGQYEGLSNMDRLALAAEYEAFIN